MSFFIIEDEKLRKFNRGDDETSTLKLLVEEYTDSQTVTMALFTVLRNSVVKQNI